MKGMKKNGTTPEIVAPPSAASGSSRPTKHLKHKDVVPGSTKGQTVRKSGGAKQ